MGLISFLKNKFGSKKDDKTLKYDRGLKKSREAFTNKLAVLAKKYSKINAEYFEDLEEILLEADVGVNLTFELIDKLTEKAKEEKIDDPTHLNDELVDLMFIGYVEKGGDIKNDIVFQEGRPTVLLVEGVNGVGKTTSIAKIAHRYQKMGKKVLLVAGDTFRAGAVEQLTIWADRLNVPIVKGASNADPASVCYDGVKYAKSHDIDLVIIDTAGRLQTKNNLMQELGKITRVINKEIPGAPDDTFLIIDATTGQNGVSQAKAFNEVNKVTGIIVTKMDGTSKGGIILSIRDELGVPVRFIGLGEKMDDLEEFDLERYLEGLLLGDGLK